MNKISHKILDHLGIRSQFGMFKSNSSFSLESINIYSKKNINSRKK